MAGKKKGHHKKKKEVRKREDLGILGRKENSTVIVFLPAPLIRESPGSRGKREKTSYKREEGGCLCLQRKRKRELKHPSTQVKKRIKNKKNQKKRKVIE